MGFAVVSARPPGVVVTHPAGLEAAHVQGKGEQGPTLQLLQFLPRPPGNQCSREAQGECSAGVGMEFPLSTAVVLHPHHCPAMGCSQQAAGAGTNPDPQNPLEGDPKLSEEGLELLARECMG